ncbi:TOX high mobility group box family member 4-like isoform X1 [Mytilus californianus]|uniref:TOX high mobility group box family member 4-like isoform X1 n=2 Tax=Mytilus californianus TaxID=6549 RepID=UPI0022466579|nr:TOX high mobility group box family member 4-like isoform X1 [Mytilus californianus]
MTLETVEEMRRPRTYYNCQIPKNQVLPPGFFPLSAVMANPSSHGNSYLSNESFHTPCFGDEDFDITSLSLPSGTVDSLSHIQPTITDTHIDPATLHSHHRLNFNNSIMSSPDNNSNGSNMAPQFPPENMEMPDISMSNSLIAANGMMAPPVQDGCVTTSSFYSKNALNNKNSPRRESSEESSDDSLPLAQLAFMKRQAAAAAAVEEAQKQKKTRKPKVTKKKKKKDPNEPQKPVSAYALFFRDTQAAIKGQNPNASFGEVSKIVAQMWDGLDPEHKNVYKKKTETAKKDYLKQLAAYRASLVSQNALEDLMPDKRNLRNMSPMHHMSPKNLSPQHNMSPQHMGVSPSHSSNHSNSMSPPCVNMSPNHMNISPQNMNMSPQHMNMSPQHVNMSPPQHTNMSPPQQQVNMSSVPMDGMGMMTMNNMGGQNSIMYHSALPKLAPNIQPRSPVLGTLMEEASLDTNIMASMCVRNGCINRSIENPGWDNEYCSTDCVVSHCRDVFTAWVANRQGMNFDSKVK